MVVNGVPAKFRGMERPSWGTSLFSTSVTLCSISVGGLRVQVQVRGGEREEAERCTWAQALRGRPTCRLSDRRLAGRERVKCRLSANVQLLKLLKFNGDIMRIYLFHPFKRPFFNKIITAEHVFYKSTCI